MNGYDIGRLAVSKAGHDQGNVYVIIGADEAYVYLADGKIRTLEHPKKKKRKHVQLILRKFDISGADNTAVKRILKEWKNKEEKKS